MRWLSSFLDRQCPHKQYAKVHVFLGCYRAHHDAGKVGSLARKSRQSPSRDRGKAGGAEMIATTDRRKDCAGGR
eukprot:2677774-Rhodomonas_salina.1